MLLTPGYDRRIVAHAVGWLCNGEIVSDAMTFGPVSTLWPTSDSWGAGPNNSCWPLVNACGSGLRCSCFGVWLDGR